MEGWRQRGGGAHGTGVYGGWEWVQAYILPMILFLSPLRLSNANRGHL